MSIIQSGRISYIFLRVYDLECMVAFYRQTLGFRLLYEDTGVCGFLALPDATEPQIALYSGKETPGPENDSWFFVIDVDDLDVVAARFSAHRIDTAGIFDVPYGRALQFRDPEGNLIQLHQKN